MLATTLDINAELLTRVFELDSFSGLINKPDDEFADKQYVVLLLGDPNVTKSINMNGICKSTATAWIDVSKAADSLNPNNHTAMLNYMQSGVQHIIDNPSKNFRGCSVTGFPNNEREVKALLQFLGGNDFCIDAITEIQNFTDEDVDVDVEKDLLG